MTCRFSKSFHKSNLYKPHMTYILHYAPDNASLIVRLALLELGLPFKTRLVERRTHAQRSPEYLKLNPNGRIPVLETPKATMFETGAILLWLADTHNALAPGINTPQRGTFLKWLFWLSNTLHPTLRMLFYPETYLDHGTAEMLDNLRAAQKRSLLNLITLLETTVSRQDKWILNSSPNIFQIYLAVCLRWMALYPTGHTGWFDLKTWPDLLTLCRNIETRQSALSASQSEGLGATIISHPTLPNPPEGSPL